MKKIISTSALICMFLQFTIAQEISLNGNIWIDSDYNNMYDGFEIGINDVKVYLINNATNEIVDSAITENYEYYFPSTDSVFIPGGSYYLEIAIEEFGFGGNLQGIYSCPGFNQANDMVDLDDNGTDMLPTQTTVFGLDTGIGTVEHIDFCFYFDCNEEILAASLVCDEINASDIFCSVTELNFLCGLMPTNNSPGNQPNPLCPDGGGPHNISWFAFIADEGNYSLTVTPTGCTGSTTGQEGVQMGLYTDCTFTETVYCDPACSTDPVTFDSSLLTPGETYYFFIDGCSSSVCSYEVSVSGIPIPFNLNYDYICIVEDNSLVCEDSEFCAGEEILLETNDLDGDVTYSWSITTVSGGPFSGDISQNTEENNIDLTFNNDGVYSVCIDSVENNCTEWMGSICRTITIIEDEAIDEVFEEINICADLLSEFDPSILDDQDPNGDGILGWLDTSFVFTFGENTSVVSDSAYCSFVQSIFISSIDYPEIDINYSADTLCLGETIDFMLSTSGDYDSIVWSINDVIQTDPIVSLTPDVGNYTVLASIFNSCGSSEDTVSFQVLDNLSAPFVSCDSFGIGEIIFIWPEVEDVQGYSLSINGGSTFEVTDTFYVVDGLVPGEEVNIEFNVIDPSKCVGSAINLVCIAPDIVNINEIESNDIKLVPNPTSDYFTIDGDFISMNSTYHIYFIDGSLIKAGKLSESRRIDVIDLPAGLYFMKLDQKDNGQISVERFVKQ